MNVFKSSVLAVAIMSAAGVNAQLTQADLDGLSGPEILPVPAEGLQPVNLYIATGVAAYNAVVDGGRQLPTSGGGNYAIWQVGNGSDAEVDIDQTGAQTLNVVYVDTSESVKSKVDVEQTGSFSAAYVDFNGGQGQDSLGNLGIISQSGSGNVAGLDVGSNSNYNDFRVNQSGSDNIAIVRGRDMTNRNEVTVDMIDGSSNKAIVTFNNPANGGAGASRNNVDIDIVGGSSNFVRTQVLGDGSLRNTVDIDVKGNSERNRVFTKQTASDSYADISLDASSDNAVLISQTSNNSVAYIIGNGAQGNVGIINQ
ncbi:major curlin subunit precursor CsgA [Vibrio maritimus]|uniref:Major curlin subunit CsgA n=1 Tax=Vibrio maritimus TaxID=990268 RepID=A0A090SZL6_9VIBR|nr:major curlin subunit precursor CsgA [Vibrio maritimus]